jgi:hypothetical protein
VSTADYNLLGSGKEQQGVGLWQPLTAACLKTHIASLGRNRVRYINNYSNNHLPVHACDEHARTILVKDMPLLGVGQEMTLVVKPLADVAVLLLAGLR